VSGVEAPGYLFIPGRVTVTGGTHFHDMAVSRESATGSHLRVELHWV